MTPFLCKIMNFAELAFSEVRPKEIATWFELEDIQASPDVLHLLVHIRPQTVPCAAGGCRLGLVYSWAILRPAFSHRFPTG